MSTDDSEREWWAEAELAKRDSEYLRGTAMVDESASVWQARAEKAEAEVDRERAKVRVLRYVLSRIFEAMPTKRDWLDPVLEKVALAETKEDSK